MALFSQVGHVPGLKYILGPTPFPYPNHNLPLKAPVLHIINPRSKCNFDTKMWLVDSDVVLRTTRMAIQDHALLDQVVLTCLDAFDIKYF